MEKAGSAKAAALDLARRGFAVFPCKPKSKDPATQHGFKDASSDPEVVNKLFSGRSDYNVGIATGPVSKAWVLDVEQAGMPDLARLEQEHGSLPKTVVSITGGGGRHFFFAYNGVEIRNKTKINGLPIDVRGDGGYVVVPPSAHPLGGIYAWVHYFCCIRYFL